MKVQSVNQRIFKQAQYTDFYLWTVMTFVVAYYICRGQLPVKPAAI